MTSPTLPIYVPIGVCLFLCCVIMAGVWRWARPIQNTGVVDIFWAFNFAVIALVLYATAPGWLPRKSLLCTMVLIAALRLATYPGLRVMSHANQKFFWFFQVQALNNVLLAIPFFLVCANTRHAWSSFEFAGTVMWVIAFAGPWVDSRHPNYFFEWLQWMAWFIFALGSPYGWLAAISPLLFLWLLLKHTGIPLPREQSLRSKGKRRKSYSALLEKDRIPDPLLRYGIRRLLRQRLHEESKDSSENRQAQLSALIRQLKASAIAVPTGDARRHDELPSRFFEYCFGRHLNYSCGYWLPGTAAGDIDTAERTMLDLTCRRAALYDGQDILELGCGWGSLSLFMAEHYPSSRITAASTSWALPTWRSSPWISIPTSLPPITSTASYPWSYSNTFATTSSC